MWWVYKNFERCIFLFLKWLENLVQNSFFFSLRFPRFPSNLIASMIVHWKVFSTIFWYFGWLAWTIPNGLFMSTWALSALGIVQYCPNLAWLLKLNWNTIMVLYCICLTSNYLILFSTHINEKCIWMKKNMNRWYTKEIFIDTWVRYVHVYYLMVKDRLDSREN